MKNFLDRSIKLAHLIHEKEVDKIGQPYISHPLHVMNSSILETDEEKAAGVLHDVVESNPFALRLMEVLRIPRIVIEAVQMLTRNPEDTYAEYIDKIAKSGNMIAIKVKLADLEHNTSEDRMKNLHPVKAAELSKRYSKAYAVLRPLLDR